MSKYWGDYFKKRTLTCQRKSCKKVNLHFENFQGMRLRHEITPRKPKHPYFVYYAECPKCKSTWHIKAN